VVLFARPEQGRGEEAQRLKGRTCRRGRANHELTAIKDLLEDLTDQVLSGELLPSPAAVANQLINTRLRAIEQERRNKETEDLEARIEALERQQDTTKGNRRWGA